MIGVDLVGLDDFAPVVVAAVPANRVRPPRLVALGALDNRRALHRQVGAALALTGMGVTGLWQSHEQPIIRATRRKLATADDLDVLGRSAGRHPERLHAFLDGGHRPQELRFQ